MNNFVAEIFARRVQWTALWVEIRWLALMSPAEADLDAGRIGDAEFAARSVSALVDILARDVAHDLAIAAIRRVQREGGLC